MMETWRGRKRVWEREEKRIGKGKQARERKRKWLDKRIGTERGEKMKIQERERRREEGEGDGERRRC